MWPLGTWLSIEHGGAELMVELHDLKGLFQPKWHSDSPCRHWALNQGLNGAESVCHQLSLCPSAGFWLCYRFCPFLLLDQLNKARNWSFESKLCPAYRDTDLQLMLPWAWSSATFQEFIDWVLFFSAGPRWVCGSFGLQASHCLQRSQQLHGVPDISQQVW